MTYHETVQIAARAGCSPATVKHFINRKNKTHPVLANAIRAAMVELGMELPPDAEAK
jgi:DNA-binding LacI/PurR family transcriptional regulator